MDRKDRKAFVDGFCSTFDLNPKSISKKLPPKRDAAQRINSAWNKVGKAFRTAIRDYDGKGNSR